MSKITIRVEFVAGKSYHTLDGTRVLAVHKVRRMPRNVHALVSVGGRPPVWADVRYTVREELITVEDSGVVYIASARREARWAPRNIYPEKKEDSKR